MKKYRNLFSLILFLLFICSSCSKENKETVLPIDNTIIRYEENGISAYTVDEEGALYTSASSIIKEDYLFEDIPTYIHKYDVEGNLIFSHEFDETIRGIDSLAATKEVVYFTVSGHNDQGICNILYSFDLETKQLERLYDFNYFERVRKIICDEDRIYLLGNMEYSFGSSTSISDNAYQSKGEKIVYYTLSDGLVYELGVNIPISMALTENGTLMIHGYLESEGYCMLEYNPQNDSLKVLANYGKGKFEQFAVCNQGKSILYSYNVNYRGLVMSDVTAIEEEAELYPEINSDSQGGPYYVNGYVYGMEQYRTLVRFQLNSVKKDSKVIHYISPGYQAAEPFGAGYTMKRSELEDDVFTLKVLAGDKDYDLSLMSSLRGSSYNLRKNGVFYPLNEVEGITEYLEACFPYVKEAATDEQGNIWMLPISVDIPGMFMNEVYLNTLGFNFKNNMTYEEFYEIQEKMTEDDYKKTSLNNNVIYNSFFKQYFNQYTTLNNEVFKSKLALFQQYDSYIPGLLNFFEKDENFMYQYSNQQDNYELILKQFPSDSTHKFYSMPKLKSSDKNVATCVYLTVNPNSKNLEDTLNYIKDWIAYCMEQEEKPLYFSQPIPEDNTLRRSAYELYENSVITFSMDYELYDGFDEVIEKKLSIEEYIEETDRKIDTYLNE